jgi:DNA-directed RNA polymerase subunit RPC12/RpoP
LSLAGCPSGRLGLGLDIKTTSEISRERKWIEKHGPKESTASYRCGRCHSEYKKEELDRGRFCPKDGTMIKPTVIWKPVFPWDASEKGK